jgi:hypothetical protein
MQKWPPLRQKTGPSFNALNRKLAARYRQWLIVQHYSEGTKRGHMRTVEFYLQFPGTKALMKATHLDVRLFIARRKNEMARIFA